MSDSDIIPVTIGEGEEQQIFNFKVPSPRDLARMGARAKAMRLRDDPSSNGEEFGLDPLTQDLYRGCALLETLLKKASCKDNWVYSADANGAPMVDSEKFPPQYTLLIREVYQGFIAALSTFLTGPARPGF
jgi:hypothetical protein